MIFNDHCPADTFPVLRFGHADLRPTASSKHAKSLASTFVSCGPLGGGFLKGAMSKDTQTGNNDFRKNLPRFTPEAMEKNRALVDLLKRIAEEISYYHVPTQFYGRLFGAGILGIMVITPVNARLALRFGIVA